MNAATSLKLSLFALLAAGCARGTRSDKVVAESDLGRLNPPMARGAEAAVDPGAALQTLPPDAPPGKDLELPERAITLVPPPAIPEEARTLLDRAEALAMDAGSDGALAAARREMVRRLRLAPWEPRAYLTLAQALERMTRPEEAAKSLKLYLLAAPEALDAPQVRRKIIDLEKRQSWMDMASMAGNWRLWLPGGSYDACHERWVLRGDELLAGIVYDTNSFGRRPGDEDPPWGRFTLQGKKLTGTLLDPSRKKLFPGGIIEASVNPDRTEIRVKVWLTYPVNGWSDFVYRRDSRSRAR